jgi:mannosidase alpha-like ER degradation enhancer 1
LNLLGKHLDVITGQWRMGISGVGAGADSYYEYLLKMYVMTGDTEFLQMWQTVGRLSVSADWQLTQTSRLTKR